MACHGVRTRKFFFVVHSPGSKKKHSTYSEEIIHIVDVTDIVARMSVCV